MRGLGVGKIIESKSSKLKVGDIVSGLCGWQQYALLSDTGVNKVELPEGITEADQVALALTGMTAMVGIYKIGQGKFQPGSTVLVSSAAGSVGSFAGQIYKNALGCRVVGVAGGPEKCRFAKEEFGYDECLDCEYRKSDYATSQEAC